MPDLHFDNRQVDLIAEGYDVAIGGGIELTEGLVARELAQVRIMLAAGPAYLAKHGTPADPADLSRHRGLLRRSLADGRLVPWILKNGEGGEVVANVKPVAVMDDPEALGRAAACGLGIAMLPLPHALPLLRSGEIVRVLRPGIPTPVRYRSIIRAASCCPPSCGSSSTMSSPKPGRGRTGISSVWTDLPHDPASPGAELCADEARRLVRSSQPDKEIGMPRGASPKREREYKKLERKFKKEKRYKGREEEVASRIVNKQRSKSGEAKHRHVAPRRSTSRRKHRTSRTRTRRK